VVERRRQTTVSAAACDDTPRLARTPTKACHGRLTTARDTHVLPLTDCRRRRVPGRYDCRRTEVCADRQRRRRLYVTAAASLTQHDTRVALDDNNQQPPPFLWVILHQTAPPVNNWRTLLVQSFTAHVPLLTATSTFYRGVLLDSVIYTVSVPYRDTPGMSPLPGGR